MSITSALAAGAIIVPLYIYPLTDAWTPLTSAIAANPSVPVVTIINPNSGPGDDSLPDSSYISAVASLNAYPNVITIGYVRTNWTNRALADVTAEVDKYANWNTYTTANISIHGVFFDEAPNADDTTAVNFMNSAVSHTRTKFGAKGKSVVVTNPGTQPLNSGYYDAPDKIVVFENAAASWSGQKSAVAATPAGKSAVIVHSFAGDTTAQTALVSDIETTTGSRGWVWVTDQINGYERLPTLLSGLFTALGSFVG